MLRIAPIGAGPALPIFVWISTPTSSGVMKMPSRLDADAAHTAADTLPCAIEVNAIEDCTVDGNVHRKRMPSASCVPTMPVTSDRVSVPSSGNSTKVHASTSRCRRQLVRPAITASRDSLAPCRKNSNAIARLVTISNTPAAWPRHGSSVARITVRMSARV